MEYVCSWFRVRYFAKPMPRATARMVSIKAVPKNMGVVKGMIGMKMNKATAARIKSAVESSIAPKLSAVPVFLASGPSTMSLAIHEAYIVKNHADIGDKKSREIAPKILENVMALINFLTLNQPLF